MDLSVDPDTLIIKVKTEPVEGSPRNHENEQTIKEDGSSEKINHMQDDGFNGSLQDSLSNGAGTLEDIHLSLEIQKRIEENKERKRSQEKPFQCQNCERTFSFISKYLQHERSCKRPNAKVREKQYQCQYCDKAFAEKSGLRGHERRHTGEKPYKCRFCDKTYSLRGTCLHHEKTHMSDKPFNCQYCSKSFAQKSIYERHVLIHTGEKPYKCRFCDTAFALRSNAVSHERIHTGEKRFKCQYCDKPFTVKYSLLVHERLHTGERPYKCQYCDKTFRQKNGQISHEKTHTGNRPFKCQYCDKRISSKESLAKHEQLHFEKERYKCQSCDKTFFKKKECIRHAEEVHSQSFLLSAMDKSSDSSSPASVLNFSDNSVGHKDLSSKVESRNESIKEEETVLENGAGSLADINLNPDTPSNEMTASDECDEARTTDDQDKPLKCRYCEKTFAQNVHLKSHEEMHSGNKPFKCQFCRKRFQWKVCCERHEQDKHGQRGTFQCQFCNKEFFSRMDCIFHEDSFHPQSTILQNSTHDSHDNVILPANLGVVPVGEVLENNKTSSTTSVMLGEPVGRFDPRELDAQAGEMVPDDGAGTSLSNTQCVQSSDIPEFEKQDDKDEDSTDASTSAVKVEPVDHGFGSTQPPYACTDSEPENISGICSANVLEHDQGNNEHLTATGKIEPAEYFAQSLEFGMSRQATYQENNFCKDGGFILAEVDKCKQTTPSQHATLGASLGHNVDVKAEPVDDGFHASLNVGISDKPCTQGNNVLVNGAGALSDICLTSEPVSFEQLAQQSEGSLSSIFNRSNPQTTTSAGERPFKCQYCDMRFSHRTNRRRHEKRHTGDRPHKCQYCERRFVVRNHCTRHEMTHTGERPFKCQYCEKSFTNNSNLLQHERTHTKIRCFKCQYCDKAFYEKGTHRKHERLHTDELPYRCQYCDKGFIAQNLCARHEAIHTERERHKCRFCDKAYIRKEDLARHEEKAHNGLNGEEGPYKCQFCDLVFVRKHNCEVHEKTHTGVKPFACQYCGKAFAILGSLRKHEKFHTGETPFKCQFCDMAFRHKGSCIEHERIHTGEKPYKCQICEMTFTVSYSLKRHMERRHKDSIKLEDQSNK